MSYSVGLRRGEVAIEGAPEIHLNNKKLSYIPQQFLRYSHTRETVEELVLDIHYDEKFPVFVCEDSSGIYIQVGVISYDNYIPLQQQPCQKIVYGRKWRVEPGLPTSEIIQTVFLALQKAREHEVRELFKISLGPLSSAPFSSHQDLPLISELSETLLSSKINIDADSVECVKHWFDGVSYDNAVFTGVKLNSLNNGGYFIEASVSEASITRLPELHDQAIAFVVPSLAQSTIYHCLMQALINLSNRHVAENFTYKDFACFSMEVDLIEVGKTSLASRNPPGIKNNKQFLRRLDVVNSRIDANRVPVISRGELGLNLIRQLLSFTPLNGFLPKGS